MERSSYNLDKIGAHEIKMIMLGAGILFIFLLITFFFYLVQVKVLKKVSDKNRQLPAGQVWLQLIPLFGAVWQFIVISRISESLALEFRERKVLVNEEKPAYSIGIAMAVLQICSVIPFLGFFAAVGSFICWLVYWAKLAEYKRLLIETETPAISG